MATTSWTSSPWASWPRLAVSFVIGGAGLAAILYYLLSDIDTRRGRSAPSLAEADRAPLVAEGDRLRHPTLGFSIQNLGSSFHDEPRAAGMISGACAGAGAQCYAYAETSGPKIDSVFVLSINTGIGDLPSYFDKMEADLRASADPTKGVTMSTLDKRAGVDEAVLDLKLGDRYVGVHAYRREPPGHAAVVVLMFAVVKTEHALDGVLSSLK